jgi:CheY-like chemotaxis protein
MTDPGRVTDSRPVEMLLLGDNPDDIRLFLMTMPKLLHVTVVRSSAEALDLLFQRGRYLKTPRPDIMVTMVRNAWDEVLNVMKSNSVLRTIPVVVWSSSSEPEDVRRAYELGASAYLVKPTKLAEPGIDTRRFCGILDRARQLSSSRTRGGRHTLARSRRPLFR